MSLYNKLRPKSLEEVVGNVGTVGALKTLFEAGAAKAPHAFLLHGPTGTGKTTFARIIRTMIGCEESDFLEVNAAANRGIDVVRELIQISATAPLSGNARLIVLDEAHQLTSQAQNALLKVMEDVSPSCFWVICTTEVGGVIKTIQNRCTTLETSLLRMKDMKDLLIHATAEISDQPLEDELMVEIIRAAAGSPRKALVILEKVAFMEDFEEAVLAAQSELQEDVRAETIELCRLLIDRKPNRWGKAQKLLPGLIDEPEKVRISIANYLAGCVLREQELVRCGKLCSMMGLFERPFFSPSAKADLVRAVHLATVNSETF